MCALPISASAADARAPGCTVAGDPLAFLTAAGSDDGRAGAGAWARRLDACARPSRRVRGRGPPPGGVAPGTARDYNLRDRGPYVEVRPPRPLRATRSTADAARSGQLGCAYLEENVGYDGFHLMCL